MLQGETPVGPQGLLVAGFVLGKHEADTKEHYWLSDSL